MWCMVAINNSHGSYVLSDMGPQGLQKSRLQNAGLGSVAGDPSLHKSESIWMRSNTG